MTQLITMKQNVTPRHFVMLGVLLVGGYLLKGCADAFSPWVLDESSSPTHMGVAVLLLETSFRGSTKYFFVRDSVKSGATPLRVGGPYIWESPIQMQEAAWSKDGSVVAIRVKIGKAAEREGSRYNGTFWIDAYDFRKHGAACEGAKISEGSKTIENLLAQRSGVGLHILSTAGEVGRHVGWLETLAFDTSNAHYNHYKDLTTSDE